MPDRKYSIAELDRMRAALRLMRTRDGVMVFFHGSSEQRAHNDAEDAWVENQLRTYMMNGTSPEELEALTSDHQSGGVPNTDG